MLKYPRPGAVKTRLIPSLGQQRACDLYRKLVDHTLGQARQFAATLPGALTVSVEGAPNEEAVREWLGPGLRFLAQLGGDLGQRMEHASRNAFHRGAAAVVVIGADCPELEQRHLREALLTLASHDLVFGPAADGGYYLIGLRKLLPELFHDIEWSSERVLEQSTRAARAAGATWQLLETLRDVDLPQDLSCWADSAPGQNAGQGQLCVVIPALNEAQHLPASIASARRDADSQVMVVDGGSTDETEAVARSLSAIVLRAPRGRARQMNEGAAAAAAEFLLFLHADTQLPPGYGGEVRELLSRPGVMAGAFQFAIAEEIPGRRWIERGTNWRARRWQLPYGDQGLFLRRRTFKQLGGFAPMPLLEDYEFVRRLRCLGRVIIASGAAATSGRRWQRLGCFRTTLLNGCILLGYHLGISPARLARWYRRPPE